MIRASRKSNFIHRLLLFLFFPFIAFITSVRHIHIREHFWIVLFFTLFFCYTYLPTPDSDATRYVERLSSIENYSFSEYLDDINSMYDGTSRYQDAYIYTIQLIVSPFSNDIRVYWLVLGFVYFYTFLSIFRHLRLNITTVEKRFNWFILGIVFIFSFTGGVNGIRWPLALMVFLLGSYRYITTGKLKYAFLVLLTAFIHFIFYFSVLTLIIFVLTRKFYNSKVTTIVVLSTFFLSTFFVAGIKSNVSVLGEGIENTASTYTDNESWKEKRISKIENQNWYVLLKRIGPYYFIFTTLLLTTYFGSRLKKSKLVLDLQYYALLNFMISFIASNIVVTVDNRFIINALGCGLLYMYHLYNENQESKMLRYVLIGYFPLLLLTILLTLRGDLYTISPNILFGNWFFEIFYRFDEGIQPWN